MRDLEENLDYSAVLGTFQANNDIIPKMKGKNYVL